MAKKRSKRRTHLAGQNGPSKGNPADSSAQRTPKSMVIRIGASEVGPSVTQLVRDVRSMMEPETAVRLKVIRLLHLYILGLISSGKKVEPAKGLHGNGWTSRRLTFAPFLTL